MIKGRVGTDLDRVVLAVFPFVARIRLHPDTLTGSGVAIALMAALGFAFGHEIAAGLLLLVGGFFDLIDGVVARSQGTSSTSGAFLDSSMDRLADLLVLSGIAIHMAANADAWGVALVCWVVIGSVMTSYTRARAEKHLARFTVGFLERAERCLILIVGALSGYLGLALWVVAIGATVTSIQRLVAARHLLAELDRTGKDPTCGSDRALEV